MLTIINRWPVIVGCIVGGLILLSFLFCCIRCLCCGAECCCGCLACCNACCPSPRKKGRKMPQDGYGFPSTTNPNAPKDYALTPAEQHQQYQSHPPPTYNAGPQYARFDTPKSGAYAQSRNPDALPSMPTWDNAEDRKIEAFDDPVEMNELDQHGQPPHSAGSDAPMMGGAAAVGGLRPGMNQRTGSNPGYMTPVQKRSSYVSANSGSNYSQAQNQPTSDIGYGGAATGGYCGAAPPPAARQSPYGTPTQRSPTKQQFGNAPPSSYAAYNPHSTGSGSNTPTYPGQRTYQTQNTQRSPTNFSSSATTIEPSLQYPRQFRPTQELPEPETHVEGWDGGVGRKPVDNSWKDV